MKKNPIQYFITDPCYLLSRETWSECCKVFDMYTGNEMYQKFNEAVAKALTDLTGHPAYVCQTGFGDWSNCLSGDGIIKPDFCADSGMVCVCRITYKLLQHLHNEYGERALICIAMINMSDDITVDFDTSNPHWTVVSITDNKTGKSVSSITEAEFFEDEEENEEY